VNPHAGQIIVIDDEESIRTVITAILEKESYSIRSFSNGKEALDFLSENSADVIISDIRMLPIDGIEVLKKAKKIDENVVVILITAYSNIENALIAMQQGAFDYVEKPFKMEKLRLLVERGMDLRKTLLENKRLKDKLEGTQSFYDIIGQSEQMKKIYQLIELVAVKDSTVLITGESGTGKELVARSIHKISPRNNKPFIVVNCGAIPESLLESELFGHKKGSFTGAVSDKNGLFQEADTGTIFLDEISAMPLTLQVKLLRILQEREIRKVGDTKTSLVDVRVIAASNENLSDLVRSKNFREDLYYRLSVVPIHIPPLRDRKEDIPCLIRYFLESGDESSSVFTLTPEAMKKLIDYEWPGNIRQLQNVIERLKVLSPEGVINDDKLPDEILYKKDAVVSKATTLKEFVEEQEKFYIQQVLKKHQDDKKTAASSLDIDLATLYRKIEKYHLD
jgi:DNA-binding NtrC family response regulator